MILLNSKTTLRHAQIKVPHNDINGNAYGEIGFTISAQTGERIISIYVLTNDPALNVCLRYSSGWKLVYYNAYSGTASAGEFEVHVVFQYID